MDIGRKRTCNFFWKHLQEVEKWTHDHLRLGIIFLWLLSVVVRLALPLLCFFWIIINLSFQIGRVILKKLKGGFYRTLRFLFPGLDLEKSKYFEEGIKRMFLIASTEWLNKREKRRRVMEHYARQKGFDPTIPSFWYSQSKQLLLFYSMVPLLICL